MIDSDIVVKVFKNKANGQKLITVPKSSDIIDGDYVKLIKIKGDKK